jgi:hypothetical protein
LPDIARRALPQDRQMTTLAEAVPPPTTVDKLQWIGATNNNMISLWRAAEELASGLIRDASLAA